MVKKYTIPEFTFAVGVFTGTLSEISEDPEILAWLKARGFNILDMTVLQNQLNKLAMTFYKEHGK